MRHAQALSKKGGRMSATICNGQYAFLDHFWIFDCDESEGKAPPTENLTSEEKAIVVSYREAGFTADYPATAFLQINLSRFIGDFQMKLEQLQKDPEKASLGNDRYFIEGPSMTNPYSFLQIFLNMKACLKHGCDPSEITHFNKRTFVLSKLYEMNDTNPTVVNTGQIVRYWNRESLSRECQRLVTATEALYEQCSQQGAHKPCRHIHFPPQAVRDQHSEETPSRSSC